ncbi:MAG: hypothetical protein AABX51_03870 [Nanoarchaeota archaeon]
MSLEELIEAGEQQGISKEDIISRVKGRLIDLALSGKFGDYDVLRDLSGIEPDFPQDRVLERYTDYAKHSLVSDILRLYKLTSIKPKFGRRAAQKIYDDCIIDDNMRELAELQDVFGYEPKFYKNVERKALKHFVRRGNFEAIIRHHADSGFPYDIDSALGEILAQSGNLELSIGIMKRMKRAGLSIPEPSIHSLYEQALKYGPDEDLNFRAFFEIYTISKIPPEEVMKKHLFNHFSEQGNYIILEMAMEHLPGNEPGYSAILAGLPPVS